MRIVLASGSAARRAMLKAAGVEVEIVAPEVDEDELKARGGTAREIAQKLAETKACAGASHTDKDALIIGSDQTLEIEGEVFSKASSLAELRTNLTRLRGRTHALHSAVAIVRGGEIVWRYADTAYLAMRAFTDTFLDRYVAKNGDKVRASLGGYWFEAEGAQLFDKVNGDYFTILGMPLLPLLGFLRKVGALAS